VQQLEEQASGKSGGKSSESKIKLSVLKAEDWADFCSHS
jgi:hypothetical protein